MPIQAKTPTSSPSAVVEITAVISGAAPRAIG
jgi:hypothetical protein